MGSDGHRRHDGDDVQEQHHIPQVGLGQRLANYHFKPYPAGLIETPHGHAHCYQTPEQARLAAAIEGVSGREDEGSRYHQQWDQVSHSHAKERAGKRRGNQKKGEQQTNSAEERRDVEPRHYFASYDVHRDMFRSLTGYRMSPG